METKKEKLTDLEVVKHCLKKVKGYGLADWFLKEYETGYWGDDSYAPQTVVDGAFLTHEFAKAFFGEHDVDITHEDDHGCWIEQTSWKWHLQQMVMEKDRVDYLRKFIETKT